MHIEAGDEGWDASVVRYGAPVARQVSARPSMLHLLGQAQPLILKQGVRVCECVSVYLRSPVCVSEH